jgi:hypothetical protein
MPFKPNYRFERIERERKKQAKKEEKKLKRQQDRMAADDPETASPVEEESGPSEH